MKNNWLNAVLLLTNRIYERKQLIIKQTGLGVVSNILVLFILELALAFISLPLYLTLRTGTITAFFSEKGAYAKVAFDYSLRRVVTLTGVSILALFWLLKFFLIVSVPSVYGPLRLYSVGNFRPADISLKDVVATETGMQTARVVDSLTVPKLNEVRKVKGGDYVFYGTGQPNSTVVLMLSGDLTAVYTTPVDKAGLWQIGHSRTGFKLSEGNHSVVVFNYDQKLGVKSQSSPEQFFRVTTTWQDNMIRNFDVLTNWSVAFVVLIGVFLTFLTI